MQIRDLVDAMDMRAIPGGALREFMVRVCVELSPVGDAEYRALLALGRQCVIGQCREQELEEGRIKNALLIRAAANVDPKREAALRALRFILQAPTEPPAGWFHEMWTFVDEAEAAGMTDDALVNLLRSCVPGLRGGHR